MAGNDLKTEALVLRRTNYGEADRILNLLTPEGKMAVIAKGVRREKSKLAGGIEMFSLSQVVIHQGRSEFAILTAARQQEFYQNLLTNLEQMETAAGILKRISRAAESVDNPEFFGITVQALRALNNGKNTAIIQAWFYLNVVGLSGEQINLHYDTDGAALVAGEKYAWDSTEKALRKTAAGKISTDEIKMMRLMVSAKLDLILRVAGGERMAEELLYIAKSLNQM